jgi:hypothetical protein
VNKLIISDIPVSISQYKKLFVWLLRLWQGTGENELLNSLKIFEKKNVKICAWLSRIRLFGLISSLNHIKR